MNTMIASQTNRWLLAWVIACLAYSLVPSATGAESSKGVTWMYGTNTTATSDSLNLNQSANKAIIWHTNITTDTSFFSSDTATNRLYVKAVGDYFVAFTLPLIETDVGVTYRTCIRAQIYTNGIAVADGIGQSSYLRNATDHKESSDHIAVLLRGLSSNDYIEVYVKGITTATGASYPINVSGQASLYVEHIEDTRTVFSGTATRTTSSTDLNQATAYGLEWTDARKDTGFVHTNAAAPQNITLVDGGDYLVFVNAPFYSIIQRPNVRLEVKLDGTTVDGGQAKQGYIRSIDSHNYSSAHWSGLIHAAGAGSVLTISAQQEALIGTVTMDGKASIFIEKIDTSSDVYFGRGNDPTGGTNWNVASAEAIEWVTDDVIDSNQFAHSIGTSPHEVTIARDGNYLLIYNDSLAFSSTVTLGYRPNPKIVVKVNGAAVSGAETKCHYIRNTTDHTESSGSLVYLLTGLTNGSVVTVTTEREAADDIVIDDDDAILMLWCKSASVAIDNYLVTNITVNSADLVGNLTSTGGVPTEVYVYWGLTNGYQVRGDWATNNYLGTNDIGLVTNSISSLTTGTKYYYSFYATNSFGGEWASPSASFSASGAPTVNNDGGATDVTLTSATLRGTVLGGNPTPLVYICWGTNNSGTTSTGGWEYVENMGSQSGAFSAGLTGLFANQTNYYSCFATNSYGGGWSMVTNFVTTVPTLSISDATVTEGTGPTTNAIFTITLSTTSAVDVTIDFVSSNGTATSAGDYAATNGTVIFLAGTDVSKTVTVVVTGDSDDEYPSETLYVILTNAKSVTVSDGLALCTVIDDDEVQDTKVWNGSSANWDSGTNWSPSGIPGPTDYVIIGGGNVTLTESTVDLGGLIITNGGTLTVYSAPTNGVTDYGLLVSVSGALEIADGSWIYPWSDTTNGGSPLFRCQTMTIHSGGGFNAYARGFEGGVDLGSSASAGYGSGRTLGGTYSSGGGGHGGLGGTGYRTEGAAGTSYGDYTAPIHAGSGTGGAWAQNKDGKHGGGVVRVEATGKVTVNGTINVSGESSTTLTPGGGSGGSVYITCRTFEGSGLITAIGGHAAGWSDVVSDDRSGAGGAGGRVAVIYNTTDQAGLGTQPTVVFDISGGCAYGTVHAYERRGRGYPGTIYFSDNQFFDLARIRGGNIMVPGITSWSTNSLTLSYGVLEFPTGFTLNVTGDINISGNAGIDLTDSVLSVGGDLTINAVGRGCFIFRQGAASAISLGMGLNISGGWGELNCRGGITNIGVDGIYLSDSVLYLWGNRDAPTSLQITNDLLLTNAALFYAYAGRTNSTTPDYGTLISVGNDILIATNSWIYPDSEGTNGGSCLFRTKNLSIANGGGFIADGRGFSGGLSAYEGYNPDGYGLGGTVGSTYGTGGAGYGGEGGAGPLGGSTPGGSTYGSSNAPVDPGSGAGSAQTLNSGGRGGGLIRIESLGTVTCNGKLQANGSAGASSYRSPGSGGGIYVICSRFAGAATGRLIANGADGSGSTLANRGSGGGGGGRIAVWYVLTTNDWYGIATVNGGAKGVNALEPDLTDGLPGTIVWVYNPPPRGTIFIFR